MFWEKISLGLFKISSLCLPFRIIFNLIRLHLLVKWILNSCKDWNGWMEKMNLLWVVIKNCHSISRRKVDRKFYSIIRLFKSVKARKMRDQLSNVKTGFRHQLTISSLLFHSEPWKRIKLNLFLNFPIGRHSQSES